MCPVFCFPAIMEAKVNTTNSTSQTVAIEVLRGSDITLWCINSCDQKYSWLRDGDTLSQLNENRGVLYITNVTTPRVFNCSSGILGFQKNFLVSVIGKWLDEEINKSAKWASGDCPSFGQIISSATRLTIYCALQALILLETRKT